MEAQHSLNTIDEYTYNTRIPEWNDEGTRSPEEMVLITQSIPCLVLEAFSEIFCACTENLCQNEKSAWHPDYL